MPKVNVQIHLTEPARTKAAAALYPDTEFLPWVHESEGEYLDRQAEQAGAVKSLYDARGRFTGPLFSSADSIAVSEGTIDVTIDGVVYMYPMHTVSRCKVWTEVEVPSPAPVIPIDMLEDAGYATGPIEFPELPEDDDIPF